MRYFPCACLFFFCIFYGCRQKAETLFTKLDPAATGINFQNINEENEDKNIFSYEYLYNGGGVALGDVNNDGKPDIYFSSNSGENKLYLNEGNLHFRDITTSSGTACQEGWKTGVLMADVNGDGWLDIYVCRSAFGELRLRNHILLINNKDLTFTEKAHEYGLDDNSYSTQAAFFDYDHDGDLDVFLLNHSLLTISNSSTIAPGTSSRFPFVGNRFLRNEGGKFRDVSDSVGVFGPGSNYGLGVSLSDLNNDGWVDIYAGSDYTGRDRVLLNQNGKIFKDVSDSALSHMSKFTMGTDIADFNGDGLMDICTLDMLPEDNERQKLLLGADRYTVLDQMVRNGLHYQYMRNMLHMNTGIGYFSEVGQLAGISNTDWSWGPLFADYDNDGIQDLFISNGFKRDLTNSDFAKYHAFDKIQEARRSGKPISRIELLNKFRENKIHNYIFKGMGNLAFSNRVNDWGLEESNLTNGVAYGDLDNDGDLDLVMNNLNAPAGIYRNNTEKNSSRHYLELILKGADKNTQAIGARVTVYSDTSRIVRELFPVRGFQSSVDPILHFGLGKFKQADSIIIRWPKGGYQVIGKTAADQRLLLAEPDRLLKKREEKVPPFFTSLKNRIAFRHQENEFMDFDIQSLLPRKYSTMGPALCAADINGDGTADIFIGGAKGQAGAVFIRNAQGQYQRTFQPVFEEDRQCEDVDAVFFDADQDGDADLYVVSGGYEFDSKDPLLQDRLYLNDGRGLFHKRALPDMRSSGSCVRPSDVDGDGDLDLFVGGRLIPGRYPEAPESFLLINDGKGHFMKKEMHGFETLGMVTDAVWADVNQDHIDDLIIVGEWMGVELFINENGKLVNRTGKFINGPTNGWWNCITAGDFDADGDTDFIIGNAGLNNQLKATPEHPATIVFDDFDDNGSVDPIISYFIMDKSYPYPSRDELVDQIPSFKKRFRNYTSYSKATLTDILTEKERARARELHLNQMQSCYLRNDAGHLVLRPLPAELQIAPVFVVVAMDVNQDGKLDFVAGGNLSGTRSRTGKMIGSTGMIFLGDGKGAFAFVPPVAAGLHWTGDVRHIVRDGNFLLVGINNSNPEIDQLK